MKINENKKYEKLIILMITACIALILFAFLPTTTAAPVTILSEDFDDYIPADVTFPPTGWNVYNDDGGDEWVLYSSYSHTGSYCSRCTYDSANDDWLVSEPIVIPSTPVDFSIWLARYSTSYTDPVEIYYSTTGNTESDFLTTGTLLWTGDPSTAAPTYTQYSYSIPESAGTTVWFALRYVGTNDWYVYTDDWTFPDGTTEGFEGTPALGWPPADWGVYNTLGTNEWTITDLQFYSGDYSAYVNDVSGDTETWLITPMVSTGDDTTLEFQQYQNYESYYEYHGIYVSIAGQDPNSYTFTEVEELGAGTEDTWEPIVVDLSAYDNQDIYVGFRYNGNYDDEWYIDDVEIITEEVVESWPDHKMHYPQLPDPIGWDYAATFPLVLADDWMCSETGWVKGIHFWGSWFNGVEAPLLGFWISIHSDIPGDPSMPGDVLWWEYIPIADIDVTLMDPSGQGFYNPYSYEAFYFDHDLWYQYDIDLDGSLWFWQEEGTIYWLDISADVPDQIWPFDTSVPLWGWKTTLDHWNDDAYLGDYGFAPADPYAIYWYEEMYDPDFIYSQDLAFVITGGDVLPCPMEVWVDDDYTAGSCGGHTWGYDAFDCLQDGVDNVCDDGGTVNVYDGTYGVTGLTNKDGYNTAILIKNKDDLVVQAVPGNEPVVTPLTSVEADIISISIEDCNNIVIDNIDSDQTIAQWDNWHVFDTDGLTIRNSRFEGGEDGIDFNTDLTTALIENNVFTEITTGNGDEVLDFTDAACTDVTIQDNLFDYNYRQITLDNGDTNFIIRRNIMDGTNSEEAIRLIDASDILVENNVIMNNMQQGIYIDSGCSDITVWHNTLFNNDQEGNQNGEIRTKIVSSDIVIKNNILYGNGANPAFETSAASLPSEDYNCIYNTVDTGFTFGVHTLTGQDPQFVSTVMGSEDLHLQGTSPCIDAGTNLGVIEDIEGNSRDANPDMGAYESYCTPICRNVEDNIEYCTIQAAIDASTTDNGETIEIYAGIHVEQVDVYKSLTIYGQGIGTTTIQSPDVLVDFFPTGSNNNYPVVYIHDVDGVVLRDVTVDGAGKGNANYRFVGVGVYQAGAIVQDIDVTGVRNTPFSGAQHGVGIYAYSHGTGIPHTVDIQTCNIYDFQKNAIALLGSDNTVSVTDCVITGVGPTSVTAQNGIQVGYSAQGSVMDNTVSGCSYTGDTWAASGILATGAGGVLDISGNILNENQVNIYVDLCSADVDGNQITATAAGTSQIDEGFWGIIGDPGDPPVIPDASPVDENQEPKIIATTYTIHCTNNILQSDNSEYGVAVGVYTGYYGDLIDFTALYNTILNWYEGVELYEYQPDTLLAQIHYNNIVGNTYGIYNWVTTTYDATCNWYGDITGPSGSGPGSGDSVSDYLIYAPWLDDTYPDGDCEAGICYDDIWVDDDADPGWYDWIHVDSIQTGVDRVGDGGTVHVLDGVYTEDIVVGDSPYCPGRQDITIIAESEPVGMALVDGDVAVINGTLQIDTIGTQVENFVIQLPEVGIPAITVDAYNTVLIHNYFHDWCMIPAYGQIALSTTLEVDARHNWWGAPDGPSGHEFDPGTNRVADGFGGQIIGRVRFDPWAGVDACFEVSQTSVQTGTGIYFDAGLSFAQHLLPVYENDVNMLWDFDDGTYSNEVSTMYHFDAAGTYQVTLRVDATDSDLWPGILFDWATITITVSDPGSPLMANADTNNFGGYETVEYQPIQLFGSATGGTPPYSYEWTFGDGGVSSEQNPVHSYEAEGTYMVTLKVTDSEDDTAVDTAEVVVHGLEDLVVYPGGPYHGIPGSVVFFSGSATGGLAPFTYTWDFGDGTPLIEAVNPVHSYELEGTYTVTLMVVDSEGTMVSRSTQVVVKGEEPELVSILSVSGGLGVKVLIKAGDYPVEWMLSVDGNLVFAGGETSGSIIANAQETVRLSGVFGLGIVNIIVTANEASYTARGLLIGPFVLIL